MIDRLKDLALHIRPLRYPALLSGMLSLGLLGFLLTSEQSSSDPYLLPCLTVLLWSVATYAFIYNFQSVPLPLPKSASLLSRIGGRLKRGWYWVLAIIFLGGGVIVVGMTMGLLFIWQGGQAQ